MDSFSQRLKEIRKDLKITQNDFANACNVKLTAISKYETGLVKPSFEMLYKIADVYNVNLNWLVLGVGEKYLPIVCLKNGTNDDIVSVTKEINASNSSFIVKTYEKSSSAQNTDDLENSDDVIDLIIQLVTKLSKNPEQLKKLKQISNSLDD